MFGFLGGGREGAWNSRGQPSKSFCGKGCQWECFLLVRQCGEFLIWVVVPCCLHKVGMKVSNGQTRIRARQLGPAKTRDPPQYVDSGGPELKWGA